MSERGNVKRGIIISMLAAVMLALGTGPAAAQGELDCAPFSRVQTYRGWGPAEHYAETVTVAFTAFSCSGGPEGDSFVYTLTGTASVFEGEDAAGTPIAVERFVSSGSFTDLERAGWPPAWWSCIASADITWQIPGVYSFEATASEGLWALRVSVAGARDVTWSHSAC